MPSKVYSGAVVGLDARPVEIEADVSEGLRSFSIVGLPDKTVEESKERLESAIRSAKLSSPRSRPFKVLINLAPADLKKEGSLYDLPIALAFLIASKQVAPFATKRLFLGELSLDGRLRPIKGALSFSAMAKKAGFEEIILPKQNSEEAALIGGAKVIGADSLSEVIGYIEGKVQINPFVFENNSIPDEIFPVDIGWIKGQEYAKRAMEITAAGGHNLFLFGPPGGGKSLLAKALPSILPKLNFSEALEVTRIYSVAGLLGENRPMINSRPFRSPHHIASEVALLGGGNPMRPGEITLAHRGVLFLDEFPEFHRDVLESLRQPIEEGKITVSRAKNTFTFPSRFMLVGASNPCPCGFLNSPEKPCSCSPSQVSMYKRKLSGPIMDRIDIFVEMPAVKYEKLAETSTESQSGIVRERVEAARVVQKERFTASGLLVNAEMGIPEVKKYCGHNAQSQALLKKYVDSGKLSARGYHRVLKVARTIADLAGEENINQNHIAEALMYRLKD